MTGHHSGNGSRPRPSGEETNPTRSLLARARLERHLEGWEAGLVAIVMVSLAAVLVAPRNSTPTDLPLPRMDLPALGRLERRADQLARNALTEPLPYDVRAVGQAVRNFGRESDIAARQAQHEALVDAAAAARAEHGDEPLLSLRAVQTRLFVHAVRRWEVDGIVTQDLAGLGGNFLHDAETHGWVQGHRITLSAVELAALFRIRWTQLVGLTKTSPFEPNVHEWRAYYRALLAAANHQGPAGSPDRLIDLIDAVARHAPDYPAALARGIVHYRQGDYGTAAAFFRRHLSLSPGGRWALRTRNHLAAAIARAPAQERPPSSATW